MISRSDLRLTVCAAMLGNVPPNLRMLKVLLAGKEKKVFVMGYFDAPLRVFERDLLFDIAGEIEAALSEPVYKCQAVCVYSKKETIGNESVTALEHSICDSFVYSEICYLRFGEEGGYEDLNSDCFDSLLPDEYITTG